MLTNRFPHLPALLVLLCTLFLTACPGGAGDGDDEDDGDNGNNGSVPAGRVSVDGHIINPQFNTDGQSYSVLISYFDAAGVLESYHELFDWSGSDPTYLNDFRYDYDSNGRLASVEEEFTYTREGLALYNHVFTTISYTYDGNGNLVREERRRTGADTDADGDYDDNDLFLGLTKAISYAYDVDNRLTSKALDEDGDGTDDETTTYAYDGNGNVTRELTTQRASTTLDEATEYTYDGANRKITATYYAGTQRINTASRSSLTEFSYDSNGNLVLQEIDNRHLTNTGFFDDKVDGIVDEKYTYVYGNNGEVSEEIRERIEISFSEKRTTQYLYEVVDEDGDGEPESTLTYAAFLDTVFDRGGGYPDHALPSWVTDSQSSINNNDSDDGWGLNWDGHDTGTCSTCGNMLGQVNTILLGF